MWPATVAVDTHVEDRVGVAMKEYEDVPREKRAHVALDEAYDGGSQDPLEVVQTSLTDLIGVLSDDAIGTVLRSIPTVATEMKQYAKRQAGSSFAIDRRSDIDAPPETG